MKMRPDAFGTAENESERAKHENGTPHSAPLKMIPGAQNMKTGPDAFGTAKNESGSAKHDNGTRRTHHRQK
jgi:hypothetical protein